MRTRDLKRLVAHLTLDTVIPRCALKKALKRAVKRILAGAMHERRRASQLGMCSAFCFNRNSVRYRPNPNRLGLGRGLLGRHCDLRGRIRTAETVSFRA